MRGSLGLNENLWSYRDEDDCGFLLNALDILLHLRRKVFEEMSDPQPETTDLRELHHKLPKRILQMKPWDVRRLMAETRLTVMPGEGNMMNSLALWPNAVDVHICFDRLFTPKEPHEHQLLWRMATGMGAICSLTHTEKTTHFVTLPGSNKVLFFALPCPHCLSTTDFVGAFSRIPHCFARVVSEPYTPRVMERFCPLGSRHLLFYGIV